MAADPILGENHCDSSAIDESLQHILHSKEFRGALQLQSLLKFIVENSIGGREDALKERIIGISVFDRRPDYETADDPIVRSRVRQLRKRLERYFESDEATGSAVEIVIPKGSYKPAFFPRAESSTKRRGKEHLKEELDQIRISQDIAVVEKSEPVNSSHRTTGSVRRHVWRVILTLVGVLLFAFAALTIIGRRPRSNVDLLWRPFLDTGKRVIIYNGSLQVYLPSTIYDYKSLSLQPGDIDQPFVPGSASAPKPAAQAPALPAADMVVAPYRYVRSETIETNLKLASLLNAHHVTVESRAEPNLPFVDLDNGAPVVLVGAYSNNWTMALTQNLPYFFDRGGRVHERGGQGRVWSTPPAKDDRISHDYAIVARLLDAQTGGPVMIVAGITTCGTEAAAEFASDPITLRKLDTFPEYALKRENLELVLETSLINCNPTALNIVAQRYW